MLKLTNVPIQIYWRALDLFNEDRWNTIEGCRDALMSAESRKSITTDFDGITPFAQAVAEDGGEFSDSNGYQLA